MDAQKVNERLTSAIEQTMTDLGLPVPGNEYEIIPHNGEWWIFHKFVGTGEPVRQFLEKNILKL